MNIAIDGPAGAGKSTIAKEVARKLGNIYVDTGAMYRALALFLIRKGVDGEDGEAIEKHLDEVDITLSYEGGSQHVILNGEDVTGCLRTPEVSDMASRSSANRRVREKLVELQQKLAKTTPVVMDGRDIGTVVLPDAGLKIYLTASPHVRAVRRYMEMAERAGTDTGSFAPSPEDEAQIALIESEIRERDYRDTHRENSPLRKAEDAVVVDTSLLSIGEVVAEILKMAGERDGRL